MFEIDVYTRTTGNQPFAIKTFKANDRAEALTIVQNQSALLKKQVKHPRQINNGTLLQFKTNRGNVYAEIEVNKIQ